MEIFFFVCSGPFPARRPCLHEIGVYGLGLRDLPVDPETLLFKRLYYDLVFLIGFLTVAFATVTLYY